MTVKSSIDSQRTGLCQTPMD